MEGIWHKEWSEELGRDMEYKVVGRGGKLCLAFPPQGGRFFDFEDNGMVEVLDPWVASGRLQVVLVDGIDNESWSNPDGDEHERAVQQERWFRYVTNELLPTVRAANPDCVGPDAPLAMTTGCSMGAFHAANFFFRRPDLFDGVVGLSGLYTANHFFPGYTDPLVYDNSPEDYLSNMPHDHPYLDLYRRSQIVLCTGQGAWEDLMIESTRHMEATLAELGIPAWIDYWGFDVNHDWPWWQRQLPYFMGYLLG